MVPPPPKPAPPRARREQPLLPPPATRSSIRLKAAARNEFPRRRIPWRLLPLLPEPQPRRLTLHYKREHSHTAGPPWRQASPCGNQVFALHVRDRGARSAPPYGEAAACESRQGVRSAPSSMAA